MTHYCSVSPHIRTMDGPTDDVAIIGSSFRLPGGVDEPQACWDAFTNGTWQLSSTQPPPNRILNLSSSSGTATDYMRGGWLGPSGVEDFDPSFFGISPGEASVLRPNARLALELSWEALERAGVPPSSLRRTNVAVCIAMGAEDGWDVRRFAEHGDQMYDHLYAQNSDPSAVAGRVAHFLDLRGAASVVSGACASAALALDQGKSRH